MKTILLTVLICFFSLTVYSQWSTSSSTNTVIANTAGCLDDTLANNRIPFVTDASGNLFVAWSDNRSGPYNVYAQKFNVNGQAQWTANGIQVAGSSVRQVYTRVVADDAGGCTIVWSDSANATTSYDIKAQRVNSAGTVQWTAGGVTVCNASNIQITPRIIQDGAGGFYISWYDERGAPGTGAIYLQRLSSGGVPQLTANGILVNSSVINYSEQHFLLKESTNAIIAWSQYNNTDYDIKAQKYNGAGAAQWGASGINIIATNNEEAYFDAKIDNSGNVFAAWENYLYPNFAKADVYMQKINSSGVLQWATAGVVVSSAANDKYWPNTAPDNSGGAFVAWEDYTVNPVDPDIYVQKLNTSGGAAFTANGIAVCAFAGSQEAPVIVTDGAGGAVIAYSDYRNSNNYDVYAQRINSSGTALWATDGVPVATAANDQFGEQMVVSNSGVVLAFFDDRTTAGCSNPYMQRINFDGTLGNLPTAVTDIIPLRDKIKVYPTLMHSEVIIENNNAFAVEMRMIDITGRIVLRKTITANSTVTINVNQLPAGVYLSDYQLKDGRRVKLPLMKQ